MKFYFIGKLLHDKHAPAADLHQVFGSGGVGKTAIVKSSAFIADAKGEVIVVFEQLDLNGFGWF